LHPVPVGATISESKYFSMICLHFLCNAPHTG
jgi:hypothetical protein